MADQRLLAFQRLSNGADVEAGVLLKQVNDTKAQGVSYRFKDESDALQLFGFLGIEDGGADGSGHARGDLVTLGTIYAETGVWVVVGKVRRRISYLAPRMLTRRHFLGTCGRALLFAPLMACERKKPELGIILNTVAEDMDRAPLETLNRLAKMGYDYVEAARFADVLEKHRTELPLAVRILSADVNELLVNPSPAIAKAKLLGADYLVSYWPWNSDAKNLTAAEIAATADRLNRAGKQLTVEGLRLGWHNHDKEFADVEGRPAYERLMEGLDPEFVTWQLDTYWAARGGGDPVELIRRYGGRMDLLHLKDRAADGGYTCPGRGSLDTMGILSAARDSGVRLISLEVDRIDDGMACAEETIRLFAY